MSKKRSGKRHTCDQCGKSFSTGTIYDRHMADEHGVMSFRGVGKSRISCGHCSHISMSQREANEHRKKAHGLTPHKRTRKDKRSAEQKSVPFFRKQAGAANAKALANAEAQANRNGWRVEWTEEYQHDPDFGPWTATLKNEAGDVLGSLGGLDSDTGPYARVAEAELALEALS